VEKPRVFFDAARIPLKRRRIFSERDTDRTRAVAVISEAVASQGLAGLEPIGVRLLVDDNDGPPRPVEIIGVVGNVQQKGNRSVSAAHQTDRSKEYNNRRQHALSCRIFSDRINRQGRPIAFWRRTPSRPRSAFAGRRPKRTAPGSNRAEPILSCRPRQ
jgi:hypothetical protein